MFCPKCGDKMQEYNKTHKCFRGDMELSIYLNSEIVKLIESTPIQHVEMDDAQPMSYFCPRCSKGVFYQTGQRLEGICSECGLEFPRRFSYHLVERHPHKNENGEWS